MQTLALTMSLTSIALSAKSFPFRPSCPYLKDKRLGQTSSIRIQVQVDISYVALCLFEPQFPNLLHAHGDLTLVPGQVLYWDVFSSTALVPLGALGLTVCTAALALLALTDLNSAPHI